MSQESDSQYGPLGPGHEPSKDPLKGLRGVMSAAMMMESITVLLALTVILKVDNGALWTPRNWIYVGGLGVIMLIVSFLQGQKWAIPVDIALQVFTALGAFIHPSMLIIAVLFSLVWAYIFYLRKNLLERMKRGLLTTQHD